MGYDRLGMPAAGCEADEKRSGDSSSTLKKILKHQLATKFTIYNYYREDFRDVLSEISFMYIYMRVLFAAPLRAYQGVHTLECVLYMYKKGSTPWIVVYIYISIYRCIYIYIYVYIYVYSLTYTQVDFREVIPEISFINVLFSHSAVLGPASFRGTCVKYERNND